MKKLLVLYFSLMLSGMYLSEVSARDKDKEEDEKQFDTVAVLEEKQDLLELHTKLTKLNIKLLEKKEDFVKINQRAKDLDILADGAAEDYQDLESKATRKDLSESKATRKILAKSEKANRKLSKIKKQIRDLEDDMRDVKRKIALQNYVLTINEK